MNGKDALEQVCKICNHDCCPYIHYDKSRCGFYGVIRQDLDRLEELEKVIDILKEVLKRVFIFKFGENIGNGGYISITKIDCNNTTIVNIGKEEYDLLREVLEDGALYR